jgi:hypothetical protein
MQKFCLYCWQPLSFVQSVQGHLFCSAAHRESYLEGQTLLNLNASVADAPHLGGVIRLGPFVEKPPASPKQRNSWIPTASRILQSLESRKVLLPSMPPVPVPKPKLVVAQPAELLAIHPTTSVPPISESRISKVLTSSAAPVCEGNGPAQLDPIVRFAARVGGFGPFKPQRSIRPWAFSAIAAGLTLAALLWGPYWTGERSRAAVPVAPVYHAPHPTSRVADCAGGIEMFSQHLTLVKSRTIVIDGHPIAPAETFEFPPATAGVSTSNCGNRQIASNSLQ